MMEGMFETQILEINKVIQVTDLIPTRIHV